MRTEPISQGEAEQAIENLSDLLETETEKLNGLGLAAGDAEVTFKREWAKSYLATDGTEKARTAMADQKCADLLLLRRSAEVLYDGQKERLRTLRARLDALRSLNSNIRAQV